MRRYELVDLAKVVGIIFAVVSLLALYVWSYFLGGPCTGTVTEVPVWCINR